MLKERQAAYPFFLNLDGFLRIISYLVSAWGSKHPSPEEMKKDPLLKEFAKEEASYKEEHDIPDSGIPIIHFEKLVTFVRRFWHERFRLDIQNTSKTLEEKIIHSLAFGKIVNAKHGPRVKLERTADAIDSRKEQRYFNQILYLLQEEDISRYLKIVPHKNLEGTLSPIQALDYDLSDVEDHRAYVHYSSNIGNLNTYFSGFTSTEIDFAKHYLRPGICKLTRLEIRAIGTHWSKSNTKTAIEKEFLDLVSDTRGLDDRKEVATLPLLIKEIEDQQDFYQKANKVFGYVDEAYRKANSNRFLYASAFKKLNETFHADNEISTIFNKHFDKPELIWNNEDLSKLTEASKQFYSLLSFVTALGYYQNSKYVPTRTRKRADYLFDERPQIFKSDFPSNILDLFEGNLGERRLLRRRVQSAIISHLKIMQDFADNLKETQ